MISFLYYGSWYIISYNLQRIEHITCWYITSCTSIVPHCDIVQCMFILLMSCMFMPILYFSYRTAFKVLQICIHSTLPIPWGQYVFYIPLPQIQFLIVAKQNSLLCWCIEAAHAWKSLSMSVYVCNCLFHVLRLLICKSCVFSFVDHTYSILASLIHVF